MADLVYPPVIGALKTYFALTGMKVHVHGAEHIPAQGPAVIASTHTSTSTSSSPGWPASTSGG
ncbi:hypothetical protein GCM10025868_19690 [Angustibacter aerolatus]|uniref:1-acyl-sn-glycerol-3-phosphate acyltransferase n=1 Tax=Angustibacter aerolatus TaxID=1162965 RepID=A0ABQ6JHY2_9ACTN|nr:hypothetical protein [Angustibacter aerolatus]GMA86719.1 hypothetical protein GCM10025868_19690 [Angustibacter aerolatus]